MFCRAGAVLDLLQLVHQRLVDRQPAGGVEDDHVAPGLGGQLLRPLADVRRAAARLGVDRHAQPVAQHLQLIDGGGAVDVGGHQQRPLVVPVHQVQRQLADGGGLAAALQAHHHDAGGALLGELDVGVDRAHQLDQLVVAQLDEVVLGGDPADLLLGGGPHLDDDADRLLLDALAEVLHHLEADVGLQQRGAHVGQGARRPWLRPARPGPGTSAWPSGSPWSVSRT